MIIVVNYQFSALNYVEYFLNENYNTLQHSVPHSSWLDFSRELFDSSLEKRHVGLTKKNELKWIQVIEQNSVN